MNNTNTLYVCFVKNKHLLPREIIEMLKNNDKDIQVEEIQTNVLVFKNGEIRPQIETSVRKKDVILISTMEENINIELVKTMLYINALHLAGAERIELWMPFFYYGRQDKTGDKREPVSAAMFASTYEKFGVSQFVTVHVHNEAIQGFFQNQFDKLGTKKLFWKHIENFCMERDSFFNQNDWIIIFPDEGAAKPCRDFEKKTGAGGHAGFSKYRSKENEVESVDFFGDVKGKKCLIFDDMIDTGGTLAKAAESLVKQGAKEVFAACTHALLNGNGPEVLQKSPMTKVFVTDSVYISDEKKFPKLEIISLAPMISACMIKNYNGESIRQENW